MPRPLLSARLAAPLACAGCGSDDLLTAECTTPGAVINEVFAANESFTFPDEDRAHLGCGRPDWLELLNVSDDGVDLDLRGWSFAPTLEHLGESLDGDDTVLRAGEHLVVLWVPYDLEAEGLCQAGGTAGARLDRWWFTGVDMDRDNGRIILRNTLGEVCGDLAYPDQHADLSWSRAPDGNRADGVGDCAMTTPTPGGSNDDATRVYEETYPCSL